MRYERVKVRRDELTVHNNAVAPWEIPVLEFIFEDGNVTRLEEFVDKEGEYPTAAAELARMVRVYGVDPANGVPWANQTFGQGRQGVRALQKLIDDAKADDLDAAKEKAPIPAPVKRKRRTASVEADSLLS